MIVCVASCAFVCNVERTRPTGTIRTSHESQKIERIGSSLEPFYSRTPLPLKGYVELIYDLNGNPSFRLIEGLLYKSDYYRPSSQTVALSLVTEDDRPFALSSPILGRAIRSHLNRSYPFISAERR